MQKFIDEIGELREQKAQLELDAHMKQREAKAQEVLDQAKDMEEKFR